MELVNHSHKTEYSRHELVILSLIVPGSVYATWKIASNTSQVEIGLIGIIRIDRIGDFEVPLQHDVGAKLPGGKDKISSESQVQAR